MEIKKFIMPDLYKRPAVPSETFVVLFHNVLRLFRALLALRSI